MKRNSRTFILPRHVIYWAVTNYVSEEVRLQIIADISVYKKLNDRLFLRVIKKHFNISRFKDEPFIWQDIWLYNYLTYDYKGGAMQKSNPLIRMYAKEILIPTDTAVFNLLQISL